MDNVNSFRYVPSQSVNAAATDTSWQKLDCRREGFTCTIAGSFDWSRMFQLVKHIGLLS